LLEDLIIIYCPPFLLQKEDFDTILEKVPNVQVMRKVAAKQTYSGVILVQSLEGIPKLIKSMKVKLLFFCYN
jgi:hypothetical protein